MGGFLILGDNKYLKQTGIILFLTFSLSLAPTASFPEELQLQSFESTNDLSFNSELQHAIERGLRWLKTAQKSQGYWSQPDHPALTALVLTAFMNEPAGRFRADPPPYLKAGYDYLLQSVQPDGGIYVEGLTNYNTAVSMMALIAADNSAYTPLLKSARAFLTGLQGDFKEKGITDSPYDGGIGYGARYPHSDMSNTMFALEALHYTRALVQDKKPSDIGVKDLNWSAALEFIQRSQNLPGHNDQPWASGDEQNKGGFIYFPGQSKAGEMTLTSGKKALRSYGSISYAGLLSYIYTKLDRRDPRVTAVYDWLKKNYTLEENPGLGAQGLFYYYHTMAKALSSYGEKSMVMPSGRKINWRRELAIKLLNLQQGEGFWVNAHGRWWERDPVLVTAYAIITLEIIYKS